MIQEKHIESTLSEMFANLKFTQEPAGLYDPLRYMIEIGGKRIRPRLCLTAYALYKDINRYFRSEYDETGSIGKRYRRQDEIGTPYCITFDFDSVNDNAVTVRNRDTMQQDRVNITQLRDYLESKIGF